MSAPRQRDDARAAAKPKPASRDEERDQERDESAPKTESPESPKVPEKAAAKTAARSEPPQETPEKPAPRVVVKTVTSTREQWVAIEVNPVAVPPLADRPADPDPNLHVARSPVNAHAPVWLGREPNGS